MQKRIFPPSWPPDREPPVKADKVPHPVHTGSPTMQPQQLMEIRLMRITERLLYSMVVTIVLGVLVWKLVHAPMFALRSIDVQGEMNHLSQEEIEKVAQPYLQQSFFLASLDALQRDLEALDWVHAAVVRRLFPNKLVVHLIEQREVALWGKEKGEEMYLLNAKGAAFTQVSFAQQKLSSLPVLHGPDGEGERVLDAYYALSPVIASVQPLTGLVLRVNGNWVATLGDSTVLELGRGDISALTQRMHAYADTIASVTRTYQRKPADVLRADMRYRSGYALQIKGVKVLQAQSVSYAGS